MLIIPAIDLIDGAAVRLVQGDFNKKSSLFMMGINCLQKNPIIILLDANAGVSAYWEWKNRNALKKGFMCWRIMRRIRIMFSLTFQARQIIKCEEQRNI